MRPSSERSRGRAARGRRRGWLAGVGLVAALLGAGGAARAGDLAFFEGSSGPGQPRVIASPATSVLLDVDYSPSSAEGGGIYGISEVRIGASGDLLLTSANFFCTITSCLYAPYPWAAGSEIRVTGGEDLAGEFAGSLDAMEISVSGAAGFVFVYGGEYLDATGPGGSIGAVRSIEPTVIATVPEPAVGLGLGLGGAMLTAIVRRRRRQTNAAGPGAAALSRAPSAPEPKR